MKVDEYMSVSNAKSKLLDVVRRIEEGHGSVAITKNGVPKAILLHYEDFEGLLETMHILSDSQTVDGIKKGLRDVKLGKLVSFKEAFED